MLQNTTKIDTFTNESTATSLELLDMIVCFYTDFNCQNTNHVACVQGRCFKCEVASGYMTGESINDITSPGHIICAVFWCLIIIVGTVGAFANILIIFVIRTKKTKHPFDFLLCVLASVDSITCLAAINSATAQTAYFGKFNVDQFLIKILIKQIAK